MIIESLQKFNKDYKSVSVYLYNSLQLKPSYSLISRRFGSWNTALEAAGLDIAKEGLEKDREIMSKEDVLERLKQIFSRDSKFVFAKEYILADYYPTVDMVTQRFGSWRNALIELGIDVTRKGFLGRTSEKYTVAEIVVSEAKDKWLSSLE